MENKKDFPKPSITGDVILKNALTGKYLFIKRKNEPYANKLACVGGFFNPDPCPEGQDFSVQDCAIRELKEEAGIDLNLLKGRHRIEFVDVFDEPNRDPRGRVVTFVYLVVVYQEVNPVAADDAKEVVWLSKEQIEENKENFAFDHYKYMAKLNYSKF